MPRRIIGGAAVAISLLLGLPGVAFAAAPVNDTYAGRVTISSIPFSATLDTSDATTGGNDADLNEECEAPATDASVWYKLSGSDQFLLFDVSESDYSAGVIVATGSPGSFQFVTCGPGGVVFFAEAGVNYKILVFDDQLDGGGNGGTLRITVDEVPPPPEIDITIDPVGTFDKASGSAIISGTVTCDEGAFGFMEASVRQLVGRFFVHGFGFTDFECDGTAQPWTLEAFGENGVFKGGEARVTLFAEACTFDCNFAEERARVRLRR